MGVGDVGSVSCWTQAIDGSAARDPCQMHAPAAGVELQQLKLQDARQGAQAASVLHKAMRDERRSAKDEEKKQVQAL